MRDDLIYMAGIFGIIVAGILGEESQTHVGLINVIKSQVGEIVFIIILAILINIVLGWMKRKK